MGVLGEIVIHANSATIWIWGPNTRRQLVASGGVSQNNIINGLIQAGAVDRRATLFPPTTIYATEGLENITGSGAGAGASFGMKRTDPDPDDPILVKVSAEVRDAFVAEQVAESNRWAALSEAERLAELEAAAGD